MTLDLILLHIKSSRRYLHFLCTLNYWVITAVIPLSILAVKQSPHKTTTLNSIELEVFVTKISGTTSDPSCADRQRWAQCPWLALFSSCPLALHFIATTWGGESRLHHRYQIVVPQHIHSSIFNAVQSKLTNKSYMRGAKTLNREIKPPHHIHIG